MYAGGRCPRGRVGHSYARSSRLARPGQEKTPWRGWNLRRRSVGSRTPTTPLRARKQADVKLTYTTPNQRLTFEVEVQTGKQAFEVVAGIQELFEEADCGCCKSGNIRCNVRVHDENKYFSLVCNDCGAQLDFGQKKDGKTLFCKRRDEDKQVLPNRGWYVYDHSQALRHNASHSRGRG